MKSIVLFPSVEEATPFLLTETKTPVFVTGADPAEMAAGTVRAIRARKPKLVILAGLATAADRSIPLGSVVEVVSARMARGTREYEAAGPATGLAEVTALTVCAEDGSIRYDDTAEKGCAEASGEVPQPGESPSFEEGLQGGETPFGGQVLPGGEPPQAQLIDRESAVFFAVCEALDMPCCCLRAVSHYRGDAPEAEQTQAALRNLTETLTETLTQISENYG